MFSLEEVGVGKANGVDDVVMNGEPNHDRKHRPDERVVNFLWKTTATLREFSKLISSRRFAKTSLCPLSLCPLPSYLLLSPARVVVFVFPIGAAAVIVAVRIDGASVDERFLFGIRHNSHLDNLRKGRRCR